MKTLLLIRHAKSSWSDPTVSDFHRKLNKRGKRDAPFMAKKLAERQLVPDLILSSPAKRAKKTAKIMAQGVGADGVQYNEAIYSASTIDLYRVLKVLDDRYSTVYFVGHNFAITDLAEEISGTSIDNIPTSGMVGLQLDISYWRDIEPGCGELLFFDYPKRYTALS